MPLENTTFISGLNANNPVGATDPVSEGDDHIRLLKSTLLNTFTGITGEVTATHEELNLLSGLGNVTGTGNLVFSNAPVLSGAVSFTGSINVLGSITGNIDAAQINSGFMPNARVPAGNVTQHQGALSITESQISDFGDYLETDGGVVNELSIGSADTTITRGSPGQLAVEGAPVLAHDDDSLPSGKVFLSAGVSPTPGVGNDGDIFLVY